MKVLRLCLICKEVVILPGMITCYDCEPPEGVSDVIKQQ